MPFKYSEEDIGDFFYEKHCQIVAVRLHLDEDRRSKGFAHVEFSDKASLDIALSFDNAPLEGRQIRVDVSEKRSNRDDRYGGNKPPRSNQNRDNNFKDNNRGPDNRGSDNRGSDGRNWAGGRGQAQTQGSGARPAPYGGAGGNNRSNNGNDRDRPNRDNGRPSERDTKSAPPSKDTSTSDVLEPPKERKVVQIKPRTLPVDTIGQPTASSSSIFGGGKPRDELAYEVR